ncbi:DUF6002 family protein [Actinoplanes sp. NPDC051475]|uniref:DUF6002 family protein n=1 Tax=Actinoplanes sp. NPDC051475 TaxID=3157225 RepID=UPI00344BAD2C
MTSVMARTSTLQNALAHYYPQIQAALATIDTDTAGFDPGSGLPDLDDRMKRFLDASIISVADLGTYGASRLRLLDLMGNHRTRTTKTFASLIIVARAVRYIQDTGERILILTPSSGNKATALRDAVLRAIECELITADQLQIVTVVPQGSRHKLWTSKLDLTPHWAAANPVALYDGRHAADVKPLAQAVVDEHSEALARRSVRLWYSLALPNYQVADAARALFEADHFPAEPGRDRLHVHSVSSAFGLLGHHFGRSLLNGPGPAPGYFLVQHLGTPDMVLHLRHGRIDEADRPHYRYDAGTGLYHQDSELTFPSTTFHPDEELDSTFYTRQPVTAAQMSAIIADQGGGGIVVSLHECLQRYAEVRSMLAGEVNVPADPRELREWSLVMAMTGVLNAIDRGLLRHPDVVVHGSGSYATNDFKPLPSGRLTPVNCPGDLAAVVTGAVEAAR